jgi:type IV pilus assembly protein PilO
MASTQASAFAALPAGAKFGLLLLVLGLVSAIYYFVFHMSISDEIAQTEAQYGVLQGEMQEARVRQEEYLRLSQEVSAREGLDRENRRVLPEDAEIPAFLQDLNRLAELSGLEIATVEPRPEEPDERYTKIPVALEISGRYHQVAKFFYNVSRLERAISMEDVSLTQPTIEGDDVIVRIAVRATTFRRATEAAAAEGAAAPVEGGGT